MREIKFRGKHLDIGGDWKYGNLVICENGDCLIGTCKEYGPEARYMRNQVYPDSVGQYTGLKDSEGTEIYEGDILESVAFGSEEIGKVIYSEDDAMFELEMDGVILNFSNEDSKSWTVIGNLYENPELLGDEIE